jgi:PAS domain S-box-containing protein
LTQLQTEIEQRKQAEDALNYSETILDSLINVTSDAVMFLNEQGFFDCNPASLLMFGTEKNTLLSKHLAELSPSKQACGADSITLANQHIAQALLTGCHQFEWLHKRIDTDAVFPAEVLLNKIDINGKWIIQCIVRDISKRKQGEERIKQSEVLFRTLIDTLRVGVTLHDSQSKVLLHNPYVLVLLGLTSEELLGRSSFDPAWNILHEDGSPFPDYTLPVPQAIVTRQIVPNVVINVSRPTKKDRVWLLVTATPQLNDDGSVFQVICSFIDITRRKEAEQRLKQSEAYFRNTFEHAPIGVATISLKGRFLEINQTACDMLGYSRDELSTMSFVQLIHHDDRSYHLRYIKQLLSGGIVNFSVVKQYLRKDNSLVWGSLSVRLIRGINKSPDYIVATLENIDARKQVENAMIATRNQLQENEARLAISQEYGGIGSWEHDLINNRQIWSLTAYRLVGFPVMSDLTWEDFLTRVYPDDRKMILDAHQEHLTLGKKYDVEYRIYFMDGQIRWMRSIGRAEFSADGSPVRFIGIVQDITERKFMEAELQRSNADLEQFAYAVSHDMRQPLRMVTSYLSLIENALTQKMDEEEQQFLNFAIDGAKRMDSMILSLLDYSRVGNKSLAIKQIDSRAALHEALAFLQPELQSSGGSIEIFGEWPEITASRDELTRLLQNLIGNALKYHEINQPPRVEISALVTATLFKVAVRDFGIGIDEQHIERLFKVFSRLNARSRFEGTGVGLALCRKIVEHHGGKIGAQSAGEGQGSIFWFELPLIATAQIEG